jgi:hypothetical protein
LTEKGIPSAIIQEFFLMNRKGLFAIAAVATLATSGVALAQPVYGPNYPYTANPYAAYPPPPEAAVYPPPAYAPYYQDTHTSGGASRAYSYWGGQKTN